MTIQRYGLFGQYDEWAMEPDSDGEYVLFSDHTAAVAAARVEAMREIARDLRNRAAEPGRTGPSARALVAAAMAVEMRATDITP